MFNFLNFDFKINFSVELSSLDQILLYFVVEKSFILVNNLSDFPSHYKQELKLKFSVSLWINLNFMIVIATKMNIHEHQAKELLREFGAPVSKGIVILSINDLKEKISKLKSKKFVLKAQIHAGGRGKAGGVKLIDSISKLEEEAKQMMGKILVTHQTGPEGKQVKKTLY